MTASPDLDRFLAEHGQISLFLDFDGVLVEIAETPDAVRVPSELPGQLERLNRTLAGALAIVSGRSLGEIDDLLGTVRVPIAGDHGNQRRRADGEIVWLNPGALVPAAELAARLIAAVGDDDRLLVEEKASAVALHYRLAPEREGEARAIMESAVAGNPAWSLIAGKMVIEARAKGVDKGKAILSYMQEAPFAGRTPVFFGDDVTDEDGFAAVQAIGGAGIKVGLGKTGARFRLSGPAEVPPLLDRIADESEMNVT